MTSAMRVSIVLPCLDAEPYLAQALGSVLEQTRPPDEIIVVDDGSSDASVAIAMRFARACPGQVQVFSEPSGHASRTRNLGALAARGDALLFLDADDVLGPEALEGLTETLGRQPGAMAICPWFRLTRVGGRWVSGRPSAAPRGGEDPLDAWLKGWYHPPCSVLWSRDAFERAGRWDELASINQDGDLIMRALVRKVPLLESTRGAAYYRRPAAGGTSLSGKRLTRAGIAGRIRVVRKIAAQLDEAGDLDRHRAAVAAALDAVAADARGRHDDLSAQAMALARAHRAALPRRVASAARRLPNRAAEGLRQTIQTPAGTVPKQPATEVVHGLTRAGEVLGREAGGGTDEAPPGIERPVVTVVIPAYNRAHVLPRTLSSVSAQTFTDFEVLVVDDGSLDETEAVVSAIPDSRLRYVRQPRNTGVSAARNRGIREARGEFIAFLDSDDEWLPEKLERQIGMLREAPDSVGLVYTGVESVREDGVRTVERAGPRGDIYREMLQRNVIHGGGSNVVMRRAVVATAGFFHEGLAAIEDYEYWLRITRWFEVDAIDEPLIRYYDPHARERRSRGLRANLEARGWLFRRYAGDMRRARVAHLFLLRDVRRALRAASPDARAARRLALRAFIEAPLSRMTIAALIGTSVRGAWHWPWIRRHAALE